MPIPNNIIEYIDNTYKKSDIDMIKDAYNAIVVADLIIWFKNFEPDENKGFMFSSTPELTKINNLMTYTGHSGASYGWTMRQIHHIIKILYV